VTARPHRVPFAVLLTLVVVGAMLALLGLNTASAANEVAQRRYDSSNASLSDEEQQLARDLAARQSPAALAAAAYKLGLIPAPNPAFLRFNRDGSVTILGTPVTIPAPATPRPHTSSRPKPSPTPTRKPGTTKSTRPTPTPSTSSTPAPAPTHTETLPGGPR
jgi:type II secretory pathway pseudopilin PulG